MSAAVAKAFGAEKVVSIDVAQSRLEFAKSKKLADLTWIPATELTAEINADHLIDEAGLDSGADVVVETSGVALSVNTAIHALRVGGSFVQVGLGRPKIEFPILRMSEKELELHGCLDTDRETSSSQSPSLHQARLTLVALSPAYYPLKKLLKHGRQRKEGKE